MTTGIRGFNPIWSEVDLTGKQFDSTFYLYTLQNVIPYIPSPVYHDVELNVPWTDPIQFLANGTLPVDVYFVPDTIYRLEFRQNNGLAPPSQADALIYEVNNYVPNSGGITPIDTVALASSNQISNPQFALFDFPSTFTYVGGASSLPTPGFINIGPDWVLNLAGTGSITVTQVPLTSLNANSSNAPYALRLQMSGWTNNSVTLRQRFFQNGMLWANQFVSNALTAAIGSDSVNVGPLNATIVDSNSTLSINILSVPRLSTALTEYRGVGQLPDSLNTDIPPDAYIDYLLAIPSNIDIYLTSFQIVVESEPLEPNFIQDSINRQIDQTFHDFKPGLEYKPIPSYLIGWDFPLNPSQLGSTQAASAIGANKSKYVWDQTIIFQSANSGVGVTRGTSGELVLTAAATTQMAVVQYLDATAARKILNAPICVNVSAKANVDTLVTVSLWYTTDASLPNVATGTNNSIVLTLDADGLPATRNGTWSKVPKLVGSEQITIGTNSTTNFNDYAMTGWDMQGIAACNTATFFAIVIGTASVTVAGTVLFDSVSLQSGSIATRAAPQAISEVLSECQYYYQKSFLPGTTPASGIGIQTGETYGVQTKGAVVTGQGPFYSFPVQMRATPVVTKYNPAAAGDQIYNISNPGSWTVSGISAVSAGSLSFFGTSNGGSAVGDLIALHWTADSRLGIV